MNGRAVLKTRQIGMSLVELMVALVLSLFLLAGLFTIFFSVKTSYNSQTALAALQDNESLAASVLANTIQAAGYFPYNTTYTSRYEAFPASGATWAAGQVVYARSTPYGAALYLRLIPSQTLDCLGNNGTGVEVNEFSILTNGSSANSLACTVSGASGSHTSALVGPLNTLGTNSAGGGLQHMSVLIGVANNAGTSVDQYYTPTTMPAGAWVKARSIVMTLTFFNPLFDARHNPGTNCATKDSQGQPRCLYLTRVISLENLKQ